MVFYINENCSNPFINVQFLSYLCWMKYPPHNKNWSDFLCHNANYDSSEVILKQCGQKNDHISKSIMTSNLNKWVINMLTTHKSWAQHSKTIDLYKYNITNLVMSGPFSSIFGFWPKQKLQILVWTPSYIYKYYLIFQDTLTIWKVFLFS